MANNIQVNVYQINQKPVNVAGQLSQRIGFPTAGTIIRDCSGTSNAARSLTNGFNVYSLIQGADGTLYYIQETFAQLAALMG